MTRARPVVEQKLDGSFSKVRADRTTELEPAYLGAWRTSGRARKRRWTLPGHSIGPLNSWPQRAPA